MEHHSVKYPRPVEGKSDGFVIIRYVASDGSSGEKLIESANAEAVFFWLLRHIPPEVTYVPRDQLTLDLKVEQAQEHRFR